ncbi:hypothetical protein [Pseudobacillus wudalianchiensis]|nr:hypothetical protein [Bacillus wudalianchiensis]
MIKIGDRVQYNEETYRVVYIYDTGVMEIQKENSFGLVLATESQIKMVSF